MNGLERQRYNRNILLPEIGTAGQETLLASRVLVVGAGGLGSPLLLYLAAAGVGHLGIIDDDLVSLSNLQRQILHATEDLDRPKVTSALETLSSLNPGIHVTPYNERLTEQNVHPLAHQYDLVVVACDNFETRTIVNAACMHQKKPMLTAAVSGFSGQIYTFKPYLGSACYRCIYPNLPTSNLVPPLASNAFEDGILGSVAGVLGSWLSTEVVKELLNIGESLAGQILILDVLRNNFRKLHIPRDPVCSFCRKSQTD
ncbi:adenylyltransferase and sulfurtransferase [Cohaesibacter marisflavi]|uniref:Adenylyltransferase and sulfurtransferase n=1 Tax=Cohaesibacter marisflavi TaxID=655353 RepID=A0A1I5LTS9_9HYPH|nr:HesA/MoeB/ThiF family protein [Cohaesibacter marisflavi]SFP00665.1 adenylyltransferase and sulfurtransferase [Cohaesibacter marisflavi]